MSNLGVAIAITAQAFINKKDKGGNPYMLHCLHVMNKMKYHDEELMMIGVMHDLVEDTNWTLAQLTSLGFSSRVVKGVSDLTHRYHDSYDDYITNIARNKDAILVKLQDLRHNSDITRMKGLSQKDFERLIKYHKAYKYLKDNI